jgi:RNA polymerase sigma-70 factor (ECF subfamily)
MKPQHKRHTSTMQHTANGYEQNWLAMAQQGDEESFARLVDRYQAPVYNLCYRILGERGEAEDAAQEAFIRAYRNLKRYDPERKFINWLLTIASNYCIDRLRRRRMRLVSIEELIPESVLADPEAGPEAATTEREEQQCVQEMLNRLNSRDRATVVLKYWYEMSYEEIGSVLTMSVSAVKSRLHRARKELAHSWSEQNVTVTISRRQNESSAL